MERNHIQIPHPAGMKPDAGLLRQLRVVDPDLDCHYLGHGRWVVGAVEPNQHRRQSAGNKLRNQPEDAPVEKRMMAKLAYRGLSPIATYEFEGAMWGHVVHDIRKRDWLYRHRADKTFEANLAGATRRGPTDEELISEAEARIKSMYPYLFRGRTHPYVGVGA